MQVTSQSLLEVSVNPYNLKNTSVNRLSNFTTSIRATVVQLESLRLTGSEVPTSVEGIEKILCVGDWAAYN
jgi:hypothetical protein